MCLSAHGGCHGETRASGARLILSGQRAQRLPRAFVLKSLSTFFC